MPFVNFYKFLAKRGGSFMQNKFDSLNLYIPDTIVYNDQQDPYWLYSTYEVNILTIIVYRVLSKGLLILMKEMSLKN